jgi:hypothetical protein
MYCPRFFVNVFFRFSFQRDIFPWGFTLVLCVAAAAAAATSATTTTTTAAEVAVVGRTAGSPSLALHPVSVAPVVAGLRYW